MRKLSSRRDSTPSAATEIDLLSHRKIGSRSAYGNSPQLARAILSVERGSHGYGCSSQGAFGQQTRTACSAPPATLWAPKGSLLAFHHSTHGIKGRKDHRRWTETEVETVREELVKRSIEEVAKKIDRTPKAIRNMLRRNRLSFREIRCDLFSVESLASALHVRKAEVDFLD